MWHWCLHLTPTPMPLALPPACMLWFWLETFSFGRGAVAFCWPWSAQQRAHAGSSTEQPVVIPLCESLKQATQGGAMWALCEQHHSLWSSCTAEASQPHGKGDPSEPRRRGDLLVLEEVQVQVMGSQEWGMRVSAEWVSTFIYQSQRNTSVQQDLACLSVHLQLPHSVFSLHWSNNACTSQRDYTRLQGDTHFLSLLQDCHNKTSS